MCLCLRQHVLDNPTDAYWYQVIVIIIIMDKKCSVCVFVCIALFFIRIQNTEYRIFIVYDLT